MKNRDLLHLVASGEITSEEAAKQIEKERAEAREKRRPEWMSPIIWAFMTLLLTLVFAACGIRRD